MMILPSNDARPRFLNLSLLLLILLAGCGKALPPAPTSVPDLSAYTNIPPGTPVVITFRVRTKSTMPKWVRDGLNSVTQEGILDSITPEQIVMHESAANPQLMTLPKEAVKSISTNAP